MNGTTTPLTGEKAELLGALAQHRWLLRYTVQGLTDEQARLTPTVSELCLGGLIKHVTATESSWADFIVDGPAAQAVDENSYADHAAGFRMLPEETLEELLAAYDKVAERTERVITELDSLDLAHPLPEAPWFPPGTTWTARRVLVHLVAETSQHAGHADILRETIDGQKSMG